MERDTRQTRLFKQGRIKKAQRDKGRLGSQGGGGLTLWRFQFPCRKTTRWGLETRGLGKGKVNERQTVKRLGRVALYNRPRNAAPLSTRCIPPNGSYRSTHWFTFHRRGVSIHLFHTRRLQHTPGSSAMLDTPGNLSLSLAQHRYRPLIQNLPSAETDHAHTETLARSICRVRVTGRGQPLYAPTLRKRCTRVGTGIPETLERYPVSRGSGRKCHASHCLSKFGHD